MLGCDKSDLPTTGPDKPATSAKARHAGMNPPSLLLPAGAFGPFAALLQVTVTVPEPGELEQHGHHQLDSASGFCRPMKARLGNYHVLLHNVAATRPNGAIDALASPAPAICAKYPQWAQCSSAVIRFFAAFSSAYSRIVWSISKRGSSLTDRTWRSRLLFRSASMPKNTSNSPAGLQIASAASRVNPPEKIPKR